MSKEPIEVVIERCRHRIDMSLDCNVGDINRLIEEIETLKQRKADISYPVWYGIGTGD